MILFQPCGLGFRVNPETLRVQILENHILAQNLYKNDDYPRPKYLIIGYMDPLGKYLESHCSRCFGSLHGFGTIILPTLEVQVVPLLLRNPHSTVFHGLDLEYIKSCRNFSIHRRLE